ncbi:MAG: hypothetical protein QXP38_00790 [Nitrososphaerota archaeon]
MELYKSVDNSNVITRPLLQRIISQTMGRNRETIKNYIEDLESYGFLTAERSQGGIVYIPHEPAILKAIVEDHVIVEKYIPHSIKTHTNNSELYLKEILGGSKQVILTKEEATNDFLSLNIDIPELKNEYDLLNYLKILVHERYAKIVDMTPEEEGKIAYAKLMKMKEAVKPRPEEKQEAKQDVEH